jgi:hypothetical protein
MAGGPLQAADDMVRIITNGMTLGGADKIASALGEQNTAAKTAAARQRAGFAGDLASVLGLAGDVKLAGLGIKAIPKIAGAVFSKKGALAAGLGLGGLAEYNARTSADAAPAPKPAAAAAKQPDINAIAAKIAAAAHGAAAATPEPANDFSSMIQRLAAGQGGAISLRQLGALSESAQRGAQADYYGHGGSARPPAPGDAAGRMLEQQYVSQFQKALDDPKADAAKAQQEFENKVLQLRKTQFIDPYGLQSGAE